MSARPNSITYLALRHPIWYCIGSAILFGAIGWAVFANPMAGLIGAAVLGGVNAFMWRPRGPMRLWAERQTVRVQEPRPDA